MGTQKVIIIIRTSRLYSLYTGLYEQGECHDWASNQFLFTNRVFVALVKGGRFVIRIVIRLLVLRFRTLVDRVYNGRVCVRRYFHALAEFVVARVTNPNRTFADAFKDKRSCRARATNNLSTGATVMSSLNDREVSIMATHTPVGL